MKHTLVSQLPSSKAGQTIISQLEQSFRTEKWDRVAIASAYASVAGVRNVLDAATRHTRVKDYRWLLGLDDHFTHPKALELCRDQPVSVLRVASFAGKNKIFHPKVMLLSSSQKPDKALLLVGSANLTVAGLSRNVEAVALLHAETVEEVTELSNFWENIWLNGRPLTNVRLQEYRTKYDTANQERQRLMRLNQNTQAVTENETSTNQTQTDNAQLDASQATICWIEVGKIVRGRELEFVAAQVPFFDLVYNDRTGVSRSFKLPDNSILKMRFIYREKNAMWRLELDRKIPEVAAGLRVGKERSAYVAVVTRQRMNRFGLRFIHKDSAEYLDLKEKSAAVGTLGKTSARWYGWY